MSKIDKTEPIPQDEHGHELRDANVRAILFLGIGIAVLCVGVLVLIALMFNFLDSNTNVTDSWPVSLIVPTEKIPQPSLQVIPEADLKALHAKEDSLLNSYGWIIKESGIVRIPIERAMEIVVERGLPSRTIPKRPK